MGESHASRNLVFAVTYKKISKLVGMELFIFTAFLIPYLTGVSGGCGRAMTLNESESVAIESKPGDCRWALLGTGKCLPEIVCEKLDVKKSDGCRNEFLMISDGVGGEIRLCGPAPFTKPKVASQKARDLFLLSRAKGTSGFSCIARCSANVAGADILPANGPRKKVENHCLCGLQNKDDRIVGGKDTYMNEFPWQVALVKPGSRQPMCGGSIINNQWILTAAHCFWFDKMKPNEVEVLVHAHLLDFTLVRADASKKKALGVAGSAQASGYNLSKKTDAEENTQRYKVKEIINHPLFTPGYDYDVCLLKLVDKIDLALPAAPTPVCLPQPGDFNEFEGEIPTVSGWGLAHELAGTTTRLLQKLEVPVIPYASCQNMMPHQITERMLCAGYPEGVRDACIGDSGGPLYYKSRNKQYVQIGIVSWGEGCARKDRPGMYSRVTEFLQWIHYQTLKPGTIWCQQHH